jgi:hypothetical protein
MLRMQRDAELRVREMRNRARSVAQEGGLPLPPDNRNWSTATGQGRQLPSQPLRPAQNPPRRRHPAPEPPQAPQGQPQAPPDERFREAALPKEASLSQEASLPYEAPKPAGTLLGDLLGATGIGEDTLLIIGLILILMNQKADTTLLLALGYLLLPEKLF